MSLIADALKRAQEQRAGVAPDPGARRLLTPSGPLRVRSSRRRDVPRSLALAGFGLATSVVVFGLAVVLSPRAEFRASTAYAATPDAGPVGGEAALAMETASPELPTLRMGEDVAAEEFEAPREPGGSGPEGASGVGGEWGAGRDRAPESPVASSFRLSLTDARPAADLGSRALAAQQRGELELAGALYRQALESRPFDPQLHNNLGTVYRALEMPAEAYAAFQAAVDAEPGYAPAWNNLGLMLGALGRAAEAEQAFREALRLDPSNAGAGVNLANAYAERGLGAEAAELLRTVLREDPALPEAHYAMARLLEEAGEIEAARRHYTLFLNTGRGRFGELESRVRLHLAGPLAAVGSG